MIDSRSKNVNWTIDILSNGKVRAPDARLAVLMDIRDELETLVGLFNCHNCKDIPNILRGIRRKLPTKKKRK